MSDPGSDAGKPGSSMSALAVEIKYIRESQDRTELRVGSLEKEIQGIKIPKPLNVWAMLGSLAAVSIICWGIFSFVLDARLSKLTDHEARQDEALISLRRDVQIQIESVLVKLDTTQKKLDLDFGNYKDRQSQENRWFFDSVKVRQEAWQWALEKVWTRTFPNQPLIVPASEVSKP